MEESRLHILSVTPLELSVWFWGDHPRHWQAGGEPRACTLDFDMVLPNSYDVSRKISWALYRTYTEQLAQNNWQIRMIALTQKETLQALLSEATAYWRSFVRKLFALISFSKVVLYSWEPLIKLVHENKSMRQSESFLCSASYMKVTILKFVPRTQKTQVELRQTELSIWDPDV